MGWIRIKSLGDAASNTESEPTIGLDLVRFKQEKHHEQDPPEIELLVQVELG